MHVNTLFSLQKILDLILLLVKNLRPGSLGHTNKSRVNIPGIGMMQYLISIPDHICTLNLAMSPTSTFPPNTA